MSICTIDMKSVLKYVLPFVITLLAVMSAGAESAVFTASENGILPGSKIGKKVTSLCEKYNLGGAKNSVKLIFDQPGDYYLESGILVQCNVEIEGVKGVNFVLDKDCAFVYTSYLALIGAPENNITVKISDISLTMPHHDEIWWPGEARQVISIHDAKSVQLSGVNVSSNHAVNTLVDIRRSSNVTVTGCKLTNYNNCRESGNLWIRGGAENVKITGNEFRKYGNDEIIALWTNPDEFAINGRAEFKNVEIGNNKVYYGYSGSGKRKISANVLFCFFNDNEGTGTGMYRNTVNRFSNFNIHDNKIEIKDPVGQLIGFRFNEHTVFDGIRITGNRVRYSDYIANGISYTADIDIRNSSPCRNKIFVGNNDIQGSDDIKNAYGERIHYFVNVVNACMELKDNRVKSKHGFYGFSTDSDGTEIEMSGNNFDNLFKLGSVASANPLKSFKLKASDNSFEGITQIYFRNLQHASLEFDGNTFKSGDYTLLLMEFARNGSLKFTGNLVESTNPGGKSVMYSKYTGGEVKYHFDNITVTGNIFGNIDLGTLQSAPCSSRKIRRNLNL